MVVAEGEDAMPVKRVKPRRRVVNIHNRAELRAWAKYWSCTQLDIRDAVEITGGMVEDVQDWLKLHVAR